jgi:chitinase
VNDVLLGIFVGSEIQKTTAATVARLFLERASHGVISLQSCNSDIQGASKTIGLFAASLDNFAHAQGAVKAWANGECLTGGASGDELVADIGFLVSAKDSATNNTSNSTAITSVATNRIRRSNTPFLQRRDECKTVKVVSGDSCASLATECGITGNQFEQYNSDVSNLCGTLAVGQFVCCTEGTLPDPTPQPNSDGSCHTYTIQPGDYCSAIAASYYLTVDKINSFNKQTWGWAGCDFVEPGQLICLSNGTAPFPAPVQGTQCGPTVPGTLVPTSGTNISMLNPCPLNACCDAWGFCGVTAEFCTGRCILLTLTHSRQTHRPVA